MKRNTTQVSYRPANPLSRLIGHVESLLHGLVAWVTGLVSRRAGHLEPYALVERVLRAADDAAVDWGQGEVVYPNHVEVYLGSAAWDSYYGLATREAQSRIARALKRHVTERGGSLQDLRVSLGLDRALDDHGVEVNVRFAERAPQAPQDARSERTVLDARFAKATAAPDKVTAQARVSTSAHVTASAPVKDATPSAADPTGSETVAATSKPAVAQAPAQNPAPAHLKGKLDTPAAATACASDSAPEASERPSAQHSVPQPERDATVLTLAEPLPKTVVMPHSKASVRKAQLVVNGQRHDLTDRMSIGCFRYADDVRPDIDLAQQSGFHGVSHHHGVLSRDAQGCWTYLSQGRYGTKLQRKDEVRSLAQGERCALADGDELLLGASETPVTFVFAA